MRPNVVGTEGFSPSPSLLSRKMICPAYLPAPFDSESRLKFQGLHAMAVITVIRRHLLAGFILRSIERAGRGFRLDLLFDGPDGRSRLVEVKSFKTIRETH